jgi:hypothetical protein
VAQQMKKAIWPLISAALTTLAAVLAFELWITKRQADPPTADTAQAVAKIEIDLGRKAWAESCGASNPNVINNMETLDGVNLRSLPRDQRDLIQEVAWRLAGADAGYTALFFADQHPMVDYDEQAIVKAAVESTGPDAGKGPAATVLKEIYFELPIIYKTPMNCSPAHP